MDKKTFLVQTAAERADVGLASLMDITRSSAKKLIDEGRVVVDGRPVKASRPFAAGNRRSRDPRFADARSDARKYSLDIVYEDADIAVVNKQQGLTVHAGSGNLSGTLVNALLYRLDSLSGINGVVRPGIVHRIDKDTTGLLVVAKNDCAHLSLPNRSRKRPARANISPCARGYSRTTKARSRRTSAGPTDRVKMAVVREDKGRRAVTHYEVLARFDKGFTLVLFKLETGRTHQIRVHAQYIGHPVAGDPMYGVKKQKFNLAGQLLHAVRLSLDHPATGERMTFEAPLPEAFEKVLETLKKGGYTERKPW
ncbi:MAG: RluA family pseudouridine synthase [Candidatus Borkfalkia sp.]